MTTIQDFNNLKDEFVNNWGFFRRWLAKHPLTGFWSAVASGLVVGWIIGKVF